MKGLTMKLRKSVRSGLFESLEERRLMTAVPNDYSELAQRYARHDGVTYLYVNFDGGTITDAQAGGGTKTIQAFATLTSQTRQQAVQDILFRLSEVFSPFDVEVRQIRGVGNFVNIGGNSTIFVGDNAANVDSGGHNIAHGSTPFASCDFPGITKGYSFRPNGDAYDIGFVDPTYFDFNTGTVRTQSAGDIVRAIAHEAGHTFGLAHVLSSPDNDVMSYNSFNQAFLNTSYNITDLNNTGSQTVDDPTVVPTVNDDAGHPVQIQHQNSFAYLTAALGAYDLPFDYYHHAVADPTAVSPDYYAIAGAPQVITPASHPLNAINRAGEYDVYTLTTPVTIRSAYVVENPTKIAVTAGSPALDPQILLYDASGINLLAGVHGSSLQYTLTPGAKYQLVISGFNGDTAGAYQVNMTSVAPSVTVAPTTTTVTPPKYTFSDTLLSSSYSLLA